MNPEDPDYWAKVANYFQHGNMPYEVYETLAESLQKKYKKLWKGKADHIEGRPRSPKEVAVARKKKAAKRKKRKAAKQARKKNRS